MNFKSKGFTLIEVMVALMIFAMIATSLSQTTAVAVDSQLNIEQSIFANWIAENEIIEMRSLEWEEIKSSNKEIAMANHEWKINTDVIIKKTFSGVSIPLEVKELQITVSLKDASSSTASLIAYLANEAI